MLTIKIGNEAGAWFVTYMPLLISLVGVISAWGLYLFNESRVRQRQSRISLQLFKFHQTLLASNLDSADKLNHCLTKLEDNMDKIYYNENALVLEDLINSKHLDDLNYNFVHYDSSDERGIDVALFTYISCHSKIMANVKVFKR